MEVEIDPAVFNSVYLPHLDNMARTQIFYGGAASGKSVFLSQRAIFDLMRGGRNYLVCREVGSTIRKSVFNELNKVIIDWGVSGLFSINKTAGIITCVNGYQILFAGLDDAEKLKSITPAKGVLTDVWLEEATEADRDSVKQLFKRQRGGDSEIKKRITLSFNPILQSNWIYQDYFSPVAWADSQTEYNGDDLTILKTWYIHNRFLTDDDIHDLENEQDQYYRDVYTFGNWGTLGDLIFTNWEVQDLSDMHAQFTNRRHGLDFGFSSDPAALASTHYDSKRGEIYIFDEVYERGLTNDILADVIKPKVNGDLVIADSAEPKSIAELQLMGIRIIGASKGKDSVNHGIDWLKRQKIIIDKHCINARNEFQQYQWKKDRDGNSLRQPVDKMNHIIDGIRYAYEDEALRGDLVVF